MFNAGDIDWDFVDLTDKVLTNLAGPTLRLKENVLQPNKTYRIVLSVSEPFPAVISYYLLQSCSLPTSVNVDQNMRKFIY